MPNSTSSDGSGCTFRFGVFEVDCQQQELRKSGLRVKLQPQPFQILVALLERHGELVSRRDLQGTLWPAETYVEFDHSLNRAVVKLRDALGDSADSPRFIETIPKRGYRFVAPVARFVRPPAPAQRPEPEAIPAQRAFPLWLRAFTAVAFFAVVFVLIWRFERPASPAPIRSLVVLPLQNLSADAGQEYFADGITDELITDLARIRNLRVLSRTTAMHYKGTTETLPEIARRLGVDAVIEGSVSRSQSRIRVRVQSVRPKTEPLIAFVDFYRGQKNAFRIKPMKITQRLPNAVKTMSIRFSIGLRRLAPGEYKCQVTVLNPLAQKATFWRAAVEIVD